MCIRDSLWGFTPAYVQEAKAGFAAFLQASLPVNPMKCEYYLPTVVTNALEAGKADVHVLTSADKWHGITYREDKPEPVSYTHLSGVGVAAAVGAGEGVAVGTGVGRRSGFWGL